MCRVNKFCETCEGWFEVDENEDESLCPYCGEILISEEDAPIL